MCGTSYDVARLKKTVTGSTETTRPSWMVNPCGWFIHEFTETTDQAPRIPATATGTPLHQCAHGRSLRQPYRYTPVNTASTKNHTPSTLKPIPSAEPNRPMSPGHSNPIS